MTYRDVSDLYADRYAHITVEERDSDTAYTRRVRCGCGYVGTFQPHWRIPERVAVHQGECLLARIPRRD